MDSKEPNFTATIAVGPPEKMGPGKIPWPIVLELRYDGPELSNPQIRYKCEVLAKEGDTGEEETTHTDENGHKLESEQSDIGGLIVFRDLLVPENTCKCRLRITLRHKDFTIQVEVPDVVKETEWFDVDKEFDDTKLSIKQHDVNFIKTHEAVFKSNALWQFEPYFPKA